VPTPKNSWRSFQLKVRDWQEAVCRKCRVRRRKCRVRRWLPNVLPPIGAVSRRS
jgi:hypothetical protein